MMLDNGTRGFDACRLLLVGICVVLAACSKSEKSDSAAKPDRPSSEAQSARLATFDENLNAISAQQQSAPRDHWDPQYIVDTVGKDPQKLFGWVKDNTVWIPYRGILRGPAGVLMDRQGNALDRAYLLATLLKAAGHPVQLVHGELESEKASELLPDLVARQVGAYGAAPVQDSSLAETLQSTAAQFDGNEPNAAQTLAQSNEKTDRMLAELDGRVADQTKRLLSAVSKGDQREEWNGRYTATLSALQDHWWVQRQEGEAWIDLDLLSADSSPLASASDVLQLEDVDSAAPHQEIALRVIAERWADGALTEHTALEQIIRPAALLGKSIVVQFWPEKPSDDAGAADANDAELVDPRTWQALVFVDGELVSGAELPDTGEDLNAPQKGGAFGGIAGAFGNTVNTNPGPARKGTLSAVWLEYELRAPGSAPRTIRRQVFDLVGPDVRAKGSPNAFELSAAMRQERGWALMMGTEILPLVSNVSPQFLAHLMGQTLLENRTLIHGALTADPSADLGELLDGAKPPVSSLYALALAQQRKRDPRYSLIDRPVILTSHVYPKSQGQEVAFVAATDIVANETGVSLAKPDAFAVRLEQGIRDTNAESLVKGEEPHSNTGDAFASSSTWATLTSPDPDAVNRLGLASDVRRRILSDLDAGYAVVAPKSPVPMGPGAFSGWWRVDPNTGDTLGFGAQGWGQEAPETGVTTTPSRAATPSFLKIWGPRFLKVAAFNYGICMGLSVKLRVEKELKIEKEYKGKKAKVGKDDSFDDHVQAAVTAVKVAVSDSNGVCLGESIFVGALVTAPLIARTFPGEVAPPPEPPPPEEPCDPLAETQPDLSTTQPDLGKTAPNLGETQPDLGRTQGDLGETQGDLRATQPDLGRTQGDLGRTQGDLRTTEPDLGRTQGDLSRTQPDLDTTQPDLGRTEPNGRVTQNNRGPQVGGSGGPGGARPPSSSGKAPRSAEAPNQEAVDGAENAAQRGSQAKTGEQNQTGGDKPVVVRSSKSAYSDLPADAPKEVVQKAIESARSDLQAARETMSANRTELQEASKKLAEVQKIAEQKTTDAVRYGAKRLEKSGYYDPENYDPNVEARLHSEAEAADIDGMKAKAQRERVSEKMQDSHARVLEIQQELKALEKRLGGGACQ